MTKLKSLIIGCGAISHTHVNAIKTLGLSEIVAVSDVKPERAEALADEAGGVGVFSDYRQMLDDTSPENAVVHICTPHYLHAQMAIDAMKRGFDVYLEKPCAMTVAEAKKIERVSRETGKRVCVSFQNRLVNTTLEAKRILADGSLGALRGIKGIVTWERSGKYYTESAWRGKWSTEGGGVLMNQSIHTLDLMYCFGGKVERVEGSVALRKNRGTIEVEDTAEATIWFENGVTGIFYATNCHVVSTPAELELVCERGSLIIRNDRLYVNADGVLREATTNDGAAVGKAVWGAGHVAMIGEFYKAILGEGGDYCDISDGYRVLEIIERIYGTSECKLR